MTDLNIDGPINVATLVIPDDLIVGIVGPRRWGKRSWVSQVTRWILPPTSRLLVDGREGVGTYAEQRARKRGLQVGSLRIGVCPKGVTPSKWPHIQAERFVEKADRIIAFYDGEDDHTLRYIKAAAAADKVAGLAMWAGGETGFSTFLINTNVPVLPLERSRELVERLAS